MAERVMLMRKQRLEHIAVAVDKILSFTKGMTLKEFTENEVTQLAVIKLFEIIGEAAYKIDSTFKRDHDQIEWRKIEGLRHILVHEYYRVQPAILWNTKNLYLPDLAIAIGHLLEKE